MHKLKEEIKRGIKGVALIVTTFGLVLGTTFVVLYGFGFIGNKLETTIGVQYENDVDTKLAILNCIDDEFAQFDENKISSSTLRDFLISVKDGSLRMELNN